MANQNAKHLEKKYLRISKHALNNENENLNYDCFAYYFPYDQQKTTYSFHGKPQGTKEIKFKIVVEPNNKNPNEKIFLIGSKTIEKDKDPSKAYLLFEK